MSADRVAKLTITRGLPGSGKTTWAKGQPDAWRVNRDDIRAMFTGGWNYDDGQAESMVSVLQKQLVKELLHAGKHVIVDDTNLPWKHVQEMINFVRGFRLLTVEIYVKEFLHVPVEVCIERDAARLHPVGSDVIEAMYRKYLGE